MKKMFYAVAVIATMAVCSCGNKAENTTATEIVGEATEIVTESAATPCDSCKNACGDTCTVACDSLQNCLRQLQGCSPRCKINSSQDYNTKQ